MDRMPYQNGITISSPLLVRNTFIAFNLMFILAMLCLYYTFNAALAVVMLRFGRSDICLLNHRVEEVLSFLMSQQKCLSAGYSDYFEVMFTKRSLTTRKRIFGKKTYFQKLVGLTEAHRIKFSNSSGISDLWVTSAGQQSTVPRPEALKGW